MKPILFNTEMVRAILEGRKTVTRRVIKPKYEGKYYPIWEYPEKLIFEKSSMDGWWQIWNEKVGNPYTCTKAPYQVGDILYVRETWSEWTGGYIYKVWTGPFPQAGQFKHTKWHPSIHMPKEAARIFLKVTDVRVERLQEITPKQAGNEGVSWETDNSGQFRRWQFHKLWDSTVPKKDLDEYGWNANPWVWVIEFERFEKGGTE